jgi:AraC family transcriptional regulator of adaptative response / DNA-3-methyladenine glycosylase II
MTNVALASGFGCVRRFNATIRKTYKRTPTQIRRLVRHKSVPNENQYFFQLRFRPPYHWKGMMAFLAAHAIPGVEAVNLESYRRSIFVNGCHGYFDVSLDAANNALAVRVQIPSPQSLYQIVERIRRMFDLNADWSAIAQSLGADSELRARIRAKPGLRVPGCWDGFELTTRAVIGQGITTKNATALAARIAKSLGQPISGPDGLTHLFPTAKILAITKLTSVGVHRKKSETIRSLARAVCDQKLCFDRIVDSDAFLSQFRAIPGFTARTAQYVAMRALGEPDVLPAADKPQLRALGLKTQSDLEKRAEAWRPWRSYASMYLSAAAATPKAPEK